MRYNIFLLLTALSLLNSSLAHSDESQAINNPVNSAPNVQRQISVRSYEIFQKRKLRIHFVIYESDGLGRFLLNTLDAKSFRLISATESEIPIEPTSLSTFTTRSPQAYRHTAIVFDAHQSLSQPYFEAIRTGVAGFLGGFRSDVLSVRTSTSKKEARIAWSAPGQSENPRAVQKSVLESVRMDGHQGIAAGVCAASEELSSDSNESLAAQKNLIFIAGTAGDNDSIWRDTQACLESAAGAGYRIFWLRVHDQFMTTGKSDSELERLVEKSGGFVSLLGVSSDPMAAMNNLRSYLDDEYVIEFDLSEYQPYSDELKFSLTANYHGNIYRTNEIEFEGFTAAPRPEEIERVEKMRSLELKKERQRSILLFVALAATMGLVFYLIRRKTSNCSKCGYRVASSFQDCPFRNEKCEGRLSVVQGEELGVEFPLFSGENTLGRGANNTVRLTSKSVSRNHGKLVMTKRKALLYPVKGSETRVNGVIATEPRLLASGTILKLGEVVCRVDFKEGK